MASSGLKKMFYIIFEHLKVYGKILCSATFLDTLCLLNIFMADIMPQCYMGRCYHCMICGRCFNHWGRCYILIFCKWQVLLPCDVVEDVKPHGLNVTTCYFGRCYSQVADGIATTGWFYVSIGRCFLSVADGVATGSVFILILVLRC